MKSAKLLTSAMFILVVIFAAGCSKTDSVLGPNSLNNQVSFSISQQPGINGGTDFLFKPGVDIKVSRIVSRLDAQNFTDTIRYTNTNYVYSKDSLYIINEYTGIENGQQWKFTFTGTAAGQNSSAYTVTANYTAQ